MNDVLKNLSKDDIDEIKAMIKEVNDRLDKIVARLDEKLK